MIKPVAADFNTRQICQEALVANKKVGGAQQTETVDVPWRWHHAGVWRGVRRRRVAAFPRRELVGHLLVEPRRACAGLRERAGHLAAVEHGVEVGLVEAGAAGRGLPRRLQRVDLDAREVGGARGHGRGRAVGAVPPHAGARTTVAAARGGRGRGAADDDVDAAVAADLGVGLQRLAAVERDDVGVDPEGGDAGADVRRELLGDERLGAAVLEEEEHERVPDDALQHHDLHHEVAREVAVHGAEQRDAHHQRVGQRGQREERDGPVQRRRRRATAVAGEHVVPHRQRRQDDELLERVGGQEPVLHRVGVAAGDEVEGEQRHGEDGHEAVDARALVRGEDAPPPHRPVRQEHGHVQRHDRRQDVVDVPPGDHRGGGDDDDDDADSCSLISLA